MFEIPRLVGTNKDENRIIVQTRLGTDVEAFVGSSPSHQCHLGFQLYQKNHPGCIERKPVTGGYNCAGLVWACRRAILPNPDEWEVLLKEDGYRQVSDAEVAVGDIAVYRSNSDGTIVHVGRVCLFDKLLLGGGMSRDGPRVPMVISKLGPTMGEVIHRKDHITIDGGSDFSSKYYTDR